MKRFALITLVMIGVLIPTFSSVASASNIIPDCGTGNVVGKTGVCNDVRNQSSNKGNLVVSLITDAINVLSVLVGAVAIIILIISGIRLTASGGDTNAVAGAKSGIIAAVIGVVVVALAQTIVIFVLNNIK